MRKRTIGLTLCVILALVVGWQVVALAGTVGTASGFEDDDGNLVDNATPGIDWNSFAPTTWTGTSPYRESDKTALGWTFKGIEDARKSNKDTAFAGGTKQDDDCASIIGASAPNKDDLKRIYLASKTGSDGHTYLNLAWVRIPLNTTSSSAHVGFEFNQGTTPCGAASDGLVKRTAGDMLIVYDFEGGGGDPVLTLRRWVTSGACEVSSDTAPCWGTATNLTTSGFAEAKVNTSGGVSDGIAPNPPEQLGKSEFGEAGIDLTGAGVFTPGTCQSFGTAYGVSRSSGSSGTAQMKDLDGPAKFNLTNCGTINIIKHTDPRGVNQDFSYSTTGGLSPSTFKLNDNGNTTGDSSGNTQTYSNVPAGTYSVTEDADPTGFKFSDLSCTASGTGTTATPLSGDATRTASITMAGGGTVTCTYTNTQQHGALKISKTSIKGTALAGATFSVKSGGTEITGSPFTSGSDGTACVDNLAFGTYSVQETAAPSGYAIDDNTAHDVTVDTNSTCGDGSEATFSATDTPLTDVLAKATSEATGGTKSSVTCVDEQSAGIGNSPDPDTGFADPAQVTANGLKPGTYTCTLVIDP